MPGGAPNRGAPSSGSGPWAGGPWAGTERRRPSARARLWWPVALSGVVQLTFALWTVRVEHLVGWAAVGYVGLALLGPLALLAARRYPGPVVAFVTVVTVTAMLVVDRGGIPPVALAFAVLSAVVRGARVWAWVSLAVGWTAAITLGTLLGSDTWNPLRILGITLGMLVVLGIGEALRTRGERMREYRAAVERRRVSAAEEERVRIARELHDVLAHSLSQINVQAGVGLHLAAAQPEKAIEALAAIKASSKTALDEVRSVLGLLRGDDDAPRAPQPGLAEVAALVDAVRIPGAEVTLETDAELRVPAAVGAAVYRIVQESLTNAARHGDGIRHVAVRVEQRGATVAVEIHDDGQPVDPAGAPDTHPGGVEPGRGLLGMRERAELLGGSFEAGPAPDGGFRVRAELPSGEAS